MKCIKKKYRAKIALSLTFVNFSSQNFSCHPDVGMAEGLKIWGGGIIPPLVEIVLTDLKNLEGGRGRRGHAPPCPPVPPSLDAFQKTTYQN